MPFIFDWKKLAQSIGYEDEVGMLQDLYIEEGRSIQQVAEILQIGPITLRRRLLLNKIEIRRPGGPNNAGGVKQKLHLMDQRKVVQMNREELTRITNSHKSSVYTYLQRKQGRVFSQLPERQLDSVSSNEFEEITKILEGE